MVASIVEKVRRFAGDRARIMVDLPTNKVRAMNISEPIVFGAADTFVIHGFELNYPGERLMGFEPTTFCMASLAPRAVVYAFPAW
jgi:hypothetical protein